MIGCCLNVPGTTISFISHCRELAYSLVGDDDRATTIADLLIQSCSLRAHMNELLQVTMRTSTQANSAQFQAAMPVANSVAETEYLQHITSAKHTLNHLAFNCFKAFYGTSRQPLAASAVSR